MKLHDGTEVYGLAASDGSVMTVGKKSCVRITLAFQFGRTDLIPWFLVEQDDGQKFLHNGKNITSIRLTPLDKD